jgi:hypothetical protein
MFMVHQSQKPLHLIAFGKLLSGVFLLKKVAQLLLPDGLKSRDIVSLIARRRIFSVQAACFHLKSKTESNSLIQLGHISLVS